MKFHPIRIAIAIGLSVLLAFLGVASAAASVDVPPSVPHNGTLTITGVCPSGADKFDVQIYYKRQDGLEAGYYLQAFDLTDPVAFTFTFSRSLPDIFPAGYGDYEVGDYLWTWVNCIADGAAVESEQNSIPVTGVQVTPDPEPTAEPSSEPPATPAKASESPAKVKVHGSSFDTGAAERGSDSSIAMWSLASGIGLCLGGAILIGSARRRAEGR